MSCFKQILRAVALMYIFSYLLQSAGVKKYDRLTFKPSVAQWFIHLTHVYWRIVSGVPALTEYNPEQLEMNVNQIITQVNM